MINYFVHLGLPLPQITEALKRLFASRPDIHYSNTVPDDLAGYLGADMLLTRRQFYPVASLASPVMRGFTALAPNDHGAVGFSLPDFLVVAPQEVDLITRAHRLYDHLFFGAQIIVVIANQLDFIRIDYAQRYAAGNFTGSVDDYVKAIIRQKYYGLAVDLRYDQMYHSLASFFGHENCLIIPAEEMLANPADTCGLLMRKLNAQPEYSESQNAALLKGLDATHYPQYFPKNLEAESLPPLNERSRALIWECFAPANAAFLKANHNPIFNLAFKAHGYPL